MMKKKRNWALVLIVIAMFAVGCQMTADGLKLTKKAGGTIDTTANTLEGVVEEFSEYINMVPFGPLAAGLLTAATLAWRRSKKDLVAVVTGIESTREIDATGKAVLPSNLKAALTRKSTSGSRAAVNKIRDNIIT